MRSRSDLDRDYSPFYLFLRTHFPFSNSFHISGGLSPYPTLCAIVLPFLDIYPYSIYIIYLGMISRFDCKEIEVRHFLFHTFHAIRISQNVF